MFKSSTPYALKFFAAKNLPSGLIRACLLTAIVIAPVQFSQAETIELPIGQQAADSNIQVPATGSSQTTVLENYGQPVNRSGSVGQPPISRWEYSNFFVYFEYDRVIHSVRKI